MVVCFFRKIVKVTVNHINGKTEQFCVKGKTRKLRNQLKYKTKISLEYFSDSQDAVKSFENEVRCLSILQPIHHPHIVQFINCVNNPYLNRRIHLKYYNQVK